VHRAILNGSQTQERNMLTEYQEILKTPVEPDVIKQLRQPERHVLVSFKVFSYLLARIETLEDQVGELGAAQAKAERA
jgi:hypothetical protein